jgi:hypothetical protein
MHLQAIISADIVPILCDHAHSTNLKLRFESLWALKHVAYNSANDIKTKIIATLDPGWLRGIIRHDPTALSKRGMTADFESGSPLGMGTSNSAGEQVDLLNPMDDIRDREDDLNMMDTAPTSKPTLDFYLPDPARRRKLALHGDLDQSKQALQDVIAVQEQAFDLIRNIICGPGATEMVDYLFRELGQQEILESLADKLRPRTGQVAARRDSSSQSISPVPPEILASVTHVMINLAAGIPRHRELLVAHRDLLRNLMNFFNHSNNKVRVNCVWIVINLIYEDDQSDHQACHDRALKLKSLGVMDRLASLEDDSDLDVRERTKTALHLMRTLLSV